MQNQGKINPDLHQTISVLKHRRHIKIPDKYIITFSILLQEVNFPRIKMWWVTKLVESQ